MSVTSLSAGTACAVVDSSACTGIYCHALQYRVRRLRVLDARVVGVVGLSHLGGMGMQWQQLGLGGKWDCKP